MKLRFSSRRFWHPPEFYFWVWVFLQVASVVINAVVTAAIVEWLK